MKRNVFVTLVTVILALALAAPAFAGPPDRTTIADIAESNPDFSILYAALQAAELDGALDGKGQFTVFAPTNAAFEAALSELGVSAADLLGNKALLTEILLYHVARGNRNSNAVLGSQQIRTMQGGFLYQDGGMLTDAVGRTANITATDIDASNGTIHIIDAVVLPFAP